MKKLYCLLFALLPLMAFAGKVKVTKPALTLENDTLTLDFDFNVKEVKVNSTQSYAFTPVLFFGKNYQTLAPVVVTGKQNFKMRRKDRRIAKKGSYTEPYVIVKGKSANRQDKVDYKVSIPYEEWMSKADMWILQEGDKDCLIDLPEITVIEPVVVVEEAPALPQKGAICEPCMSMVSYLNPTEQPLKVRSEQNTLYIEYAVGGTEFKADYKNNATELQKLKETLNPLTEGDLVTFKAINICGYASPDGSAKTNDRVATKRADSFALYLKGSYHFPDSILKVTSAGEDWESLIKMLEEEKPAYAEKALEIIAKYPSLDVREARLKSGLGASYRTMVNDYFSRLRRLSISVEYEVREVRNAEAAQLIYTNPKMLNLQEMYGVAKMYQPGTKEYKEVYEIAATNYPTDIVANINAASANIVYGDFDRAGQYMERVKDDPRAWNNMGVLTWLSGDSEIAREWFIKALTSEPEKAQENLNKMK